MRRDSFSGALLRIGALEPAGDLLGVLREAGIQARDAPNYKTIPAAPMEWGMIADDLLGAALIYSPKAAAAVKPLLVDAASNAMLVCISEAVKAALGDGFAGRVAVAEEPTEMALLATLVDAVPPS